MSKPKTTEFKSSCCDASVVKYDDAPVNAKHWSGHRCTKCGNNAPLSSADFLKAVGFKS